MSLIRLCAMVALLAMCALRAGAQAQDDANFLAAHGFPADKFDLLWEWDEAAPKAPGTLVTGYVLQPVGTTARVEVYRLGEGLLNEEERNGLGIRAKNWSPTPAQAPAERPASITPVQSPLVRPFGLNTAGKIETLALAPFTESEKAANEAAAPAGEKGGKRIGDFRRFTEPISVNSTAPSLGSWLSFPDGGKLWRVGIQSPGATGLRLHMGAHQLPVGAIVTVYNPARPEEAFRYGGRDGDEWFPTIFNDELVVEIYWHGSEHLEQRLNDDVFNAIQCTFDKLIHVYAPLSTFEKAAGNCNLSVACYPDWAETALGICGLGTVSLSGALFCTGTLIADTDSCSTTPYVLTAHHCVGGAGGAHGASSLEFYWFYQASSCGGAVPGLGTVPRTVGGADYLAGSAGTGDSGGGSDFTLVRMRNTPPNGATYVGWTTTVPALNTEVTVVHHPDGDYKRISFGRLTNTSNPFSSDYHEVTWHDGTTEPGSSGSPLMLSATQQIIGQLWGGGASCTSLLSPDKFGRFDRSYVIMQSFIDPGPNTASFATPIFSANEGDGTATITVTLNRAAPTGGIDVDFATVVGGTAVSGADYTPTNGTLHFNAGSTSATFAVTLLQDLHADEGKTVFLTLSAPTCGTISPFGGLAQLIIHDDDADTDGDGVSDYDETNGTYGAMTNPNLADTDGDGLTDYQELFDVYHVHTDPLNHDTDGDGVSDWFELVTGTDPTTADARLDSLRVPEFKSSTDNE